MATHELKTWPEYFEEVWADTKGFELRKDDRNFQVGDTLVLREWKPVSEKYTGREVPVTVTYILKDFPGIEPGYWRQCFEAYRECETEHGADNIQLVLSTHWASEGYWIEAKGKDLSAEDYAYTGTEVWEFYERLKTEIEAAEKEGRHPKFTL